MIALPREVILYIAASLDGYIATKDDDLKWLDQTQGEGDNGYNDMYESIDTVVMGRRTYEYVLEHIEQFPYSDKKCYVFSSSKSGGDDHVEFVNGDVLQFMNQLKSQEGSNIWLVGGGELMVDFIQHNLVDEYIIFFTPHLLGEGIPLFKAGIPETQLQLVDTKRYGQLVQMVYRRGDS